MDYYGFYTGKVFDAYEYLGAHFTAEGAVFRTFAPAASRISVIGEFTGWQETLMKKVYDGNFWEVTVAEARPGMRYKFRIEKKTGIVTDHCDPYGFSMELRPHNASVLCAESIYPFQDAKWMKARTDCMNKPLNIYELHFGSWRKKTDELEGWYSYAEMAVLLLPYLKENSYNFVEIMPLSEHPCDESWGYQNTGFFSPTSRYGTPEELKSFVDACHKAGVGVLLDFVPVHFAVDDYALWNYDGTALYEYPHSDVGRSEWGSCNFMHSRGEVRSFLQSAAHYWLKEFHFDGLRMDAVSNLIYWQGEKARGENRGAVQFLQEMNRGLKSRHPTALLIAEDSTAYSGTTKPVEKGGLGFDYKWDIGWMNDTLSYFQAPPEERIKAYHKLTFSMHYFYDENYLLPLSHDEVVHGKATILQKMNGDYEVKFPQARALYLYMMTHPGKKLNFMGGELGQLREWDEKREQDWELLRYPIHDAFHRYLHDLNRLYLDTPALWQWDYSRDGFVWVDCHQEEKGVYVYERRSETQRFLCVFNFSGMKQDYATVVPGAQKLTLLFASDWEEYGGSLCGGKEVLKLEGGTAEFTLTAFSGRCYLIAED